MDMENIPKFYQKMQNDYPGVMQAVNELGNAISDAGPITDKQAQLIQLGAAAAMRSEGSVHSHTRRALKAGASPEEVRHALILLISTIGYPNVAAALSWANDILES
ncbi:MAG: carboxymuconolactone decarboxylase family protein [Desulfovermiculus sp.]